MEVQKSDSSINRYNIMPIPPCRFYSRRAVGMRRDSGRYRGDSSQKKVKFSQATLIWGIYPHGFTTYGGTQLSVIITRWRSAAAQSGRWGRSGVAGCLSYQYAGG